MKKILSQKAALQLCILTDKPHIGCASGSPQQSAQTGLGAEDTLVQNSRIGLDLKRQVLVGVLEALRLLRRHLLLRDPLGAGQPLLGLGGLSLLCSWHCGLEKVTLRCASLEDCSDTDLLSLLNSFIYLHFVQKKKNFHFLLRFTEFI